MAIAYFAGREQNIFKQILQGGQKLAQFLYALTLPSINRLSKLQLIQQKLIKRHRN